MPRSAIMRFSTSSMLPVPLYSWKITSSMREPVSMRMEAKTDKLPLPRKFLAAPKKRLGMAKASASMPAREGLALGPRPDRLLRHHRKVESASHAGEAVDEHHHVVAHLGFEHRRGESQTSDANVFFGPFVEGRGVNRGAGGALEVRHLLGAFVDENGVDFGAGVIAQNGVGDVLEHGGFADFGRGDHQATLSLCR